MQIIKHLKDIKTTNEMSRLIEYLNENVQSRVVVEKIRNKEFLLHRIKPINSLSIYGYYEAGTKVENFLKK